jgi:hypothetical protein
MLAGATNAVLELERPMARLPATFDSNNVQLLAAPTAILVGVHVSDDGLGVAHRGTVAFCEDAPRVAVTTAWVFVKTVPAVAVTFPVALPAEIVTVAGIDSRDELELIETVVPAETGCERVIEQVVPTPDITPVGLQVTPDTRTGCASRLMVAGCELPPRVAVTVAL